MTRLNKILLACAGLACAGAAALAVVTAASVKPVPRGFHGVAAETVKPRLYDRAGRALTVTYQNDWNLHDTVALHEAPPFLQIAFLMAEDKRFYDHGGVDWRARLSAVAQNVLNLDVVRGASTITEQTVRMLHKRPRSVWARWLEGWEAAGLERRATKHDILEFYLNQVPYASNRRGVVQAARHYFDRDLATLSHKEMLALAVLVRAPSRFDLYRGARYADAAINRLTARMVDAKLMTRAEASRIAAQELVLSRSEIDIDAPHFVRHVLATAPDGARQIRTTLDGDIQRAVQALLDERLKTLAVKNVGNGAVLVADHATGEILAWAVAGNGDSDIPGGLIDAVTAPRQPGSALKPFVYALALEKGWTAATVIDDAPLTENIGFGLHSYKNYSNRFYGPVSLRDALGNSLNIPALKALQFVGADALLDRLRALGFAGLTEHPDYYGDGLALGNAGVTLFEMVQAYAALARGGVFAPLYVTTERSGAVEPRRVFSAGVATLLGDILSDADARRLEFGRHSVLNLPVQTAVKTGTSSDYRDAWSIGYNDRYVVGAWFGNLDGRETGGVTGSTGPALLLRGVFDVLNRNRQTRGLALSAELVRREVCVKTGALPAEGDDCPLRAEYFIPPHLPARNAPDTHRDTAGARPPLRLRQPVDGLMMAFDPRVPVDSQAFQFVLQGAGASDTIEWIVDGETAARTQTGRYVWPLRRGRHTVAAVVFSGEREVARTAEVTFLVK